MPLIVIAGRPCTGKTFYANELLKYLQTKGCKVDLINEESLNILKSEGYKASAKEKDVRGALKSGVDHNLTSDKYVIVDSLNYIKGYRYELYCTARTVRTTHCVVWVAAHEQQSKDINNKRIEQGVDAYDPAIMDDLRIRFEPPNDSNRWDNPLYKVKVLPPPIIPQNLAGEDNKEGEVKLDPSEVKPKKSSWKPKKKAVVDETRTAESNIITSASAAAVESKDSKEGIVEDVKALTISGSVVTSSDNLNDFEDHLSSFDKIYDHLTNAVVPLPTCSTVVQKHAEADLLYELDRISQKIVQQIVTHQSETIEGTPIKFPDYDRGMTFHRQISLAELQRYRGQFVKINAQHPPNSQKAIGASFIDFLAVQLS